jgi:hypothetical protein
VTAADRDLVVALRSELAAIDPARPLDRDAERAGLAVGGRSRDPVVARLAVRLSRGRGRAGHTPGAERGRATAPGRAAKPGSFGTFDWGGSPEHARFAWLRGLFLARGSLSIANGRTHLEFVVDPDDATALAGRLGEIGLPAAWRIRRGRGVVTWKSGTAIGTFLRRIGAQPTLLEIEARQVSRTLRGELNRIINAESSNLRRSVAAAGRQLAAIEWLDAHGLLAGEPHVVRVVAAARREMPEATLADLAAHADLHRSAVQRALDRLERRAGVEEGPGALA